MRHPLVVANWKLHGNRYVVNNFILELNSKLNDIINYNIVFAPPLIYLDLANNCLINSKIILGAQNVDIHSSGSYTGEISATMLKDIGVKYIIIGHSERRLYHKEDDNIIAKKFAILKKIGLIPILCIGEDRTQDIKSICTKQIDLIFNLLGKDAFNDSVIAYEPIWAIGAKQAASPIKVQIVHKFIRNYIAQYNLTTAQKIIIQYGGSVNIHNASELFIQPDIDGALVGRASLEINSFLKIVHTVFTSKSRYNLISH